MIPFSFTIHGRQMEEDEDDDVDDESEFADDESFASVDDLEGRIRAVTIIFSI